LAPYPLNAKSVLSGRVCARFHSAGGFPAALPNLLKEVKNVLLLSKRKHAIIPVGNLKVELPMKEKPDVLQGTFALMVLLA
jgi:hypothetical protein